MVSQNLLSVTRNYRCFTSRGQPRCCVRRASGLVLTRISRIWISRLLPFEKVVECERVHTFIVVDYDAVSGPRVKSFRINSLSPMTPEPDSCLVREWPPSRELHGGSFIDPCGLATLMPEEETESPEEVRS
jgi:hypothetical protein